MLLNRLSLIGFLAVFGSLLAGCGPISAAFHDPRALRVLGQDSRIHYEPGAEAYAREVERILPYAMAKVEALHGRPSASLSLSPLFWTMGLTRQLMAGVMRLPVGSLFSTA